MEGLYFGFISSVNPEQGTVKVTFTGENDVVSDMLPLLAAEYDIPEIGAYVAVIFGKNGRGVCLGKVFSNSNRPPASAGFAKKINNILISENGGTFKIALPDNAFIEYKNKTLHISADRIILDEKNGVRGE